MPVLRGEGLVRRYGRRTVVEVETIGVGRSEVLAVLGPNGAGKSALFRMLGLIERPDAGRVWLNEEPVRAGDVARIRRIGAVFQQPYLFRGTVSFNVEWGLRARRISARERADRVQEAIQWLGLTRLANADVSTLSGGERQRVALARALVTRPEVLLLDEPTANLDVTHRRRFREDLDRLVRQTAGAAILITHDPDDAFSLADRIAIMEAGRIVQEGEPGDVVLSPVTPFAAALTGAELLLDGTAEFVEAGLTTVSVGGTTVIAATAPDADPLRVGQPVHVAYRPEDVLLAIPGEVGTTSAVNQYPLEVAAVVPSTALVRVRLTGALTLQALVTRRSADSLRLEPGSAIVAHVKATALRAFAAP